MIDQEAHYRGAFMLHDHIITFVCGRAAHISLWCRQGNGMRRRPDERRYKTTGFLVVQARDEVNLRSFMIGVAVCSVTTPALTMKISWDWSIKGEFCAESRFL